MSKNFEKVPSKAFTIIDKDTCFAAVGDGDSFEMLAYSGKPLKHWWFGDLIIDLSGMKFPKPKFPILQSHNPDLKIGFVKKPRNVGNELRFGDKEFSFIDSPESILFREQAKQGFPFEASVGIRPTKITRLEENATATINGHKVKAPMTIFSESIFRESSVVVFGADPHTKSRVFEDEEECEIEVEFIQVEVPDSSEEEKSDKGGEVMNLAELKAKYPDLVTEIQTEVRAETEAEFQSKNDNLQSDNQELSKKIVKITTTLSEQSEQIKELERQNEKKEALKQEQDLKAEANALWDIQLAESDLPAHLHPKIKKMVPHSKFMTEDSLNVEAFTEALKVEIATWKTEEDEDEEVKGLSHSRSDTKTSSKEDKDWTKDMLKSSGDEEAVKKLDEKKV